MVVVDVYIIFWKDALWFVPCQGSHHTGSMLFVAHIWWGFHEKSNFECQKVTS
jgi:hypothetical protein